MLLLSLVSFVAGTAEWLVPVVLGAGWEPVVPLIRVMCVAGVFHAIANIIYWVMLAQGKTGLLFGSELGVRLVMIALITAAVAKGPLWVALASAVGQGLLLVSFVSSRCHARPFRRAQYCSRRCGLSSCSRSRPAPRLVPATSPAPCLMWSYC